MSLSLAMSREEREAFLADVHVGVLAVAADGQPPLTAPLWYHYEPGGLVSFVTAGDALKLRLLRAEGQASLCAQSEEPPYKYVTVEGRVVELVEHVDPDERRAIAHRYLGPEQGDQYLASTEGLDTFTVRIAPERWRTVDFSKMY
jgi:PPOX class probable F420-dependent enzyme